MSVKSPVALTRFYGRKERSRSSLRIISIQIGSIIFCKEDVPPWTRGFNFTGIITCEIATIFFASELFRKIAHAVDNHRVDVASG